ncbi:MAG: caspase family protein [Alphaproteobacteria bacterium]
MVSIPSRESTATTSFEFPNTTANATASPRITAPKSVPANDTVSEQSGPTDEHRVALVIGNARYAESPLKNPVNDSRAMAQILRSQGFDVIARENTTKAQMEDAVAAFGERLSRGAVGLMYYSGHGLQVGGKNYLVPVDVRFTTEQAVPLRTVDADNILNQMVAAQTRVNVVILDACRNNPFERRFRSVGGGLAQMSAPRGTIIAYATAPGKEASDGDDGNGLYTQELLKAMAAPGVKVEEVFKQVRVAVAQASNDAQIPWEASSLTGDFYFVPGSGVAQTPTDARANPVVQSGLDAADQGSARAQFDIGIAYASGKGVTQNYAEAVKWFRKAADQGHADAQFNLGVRYASGAGVTEDYAKAVTWFHKAADQGHTGAQFGLGLMYASGEGVTQDYAKAVKWFRKAADQGHADAQYNLGVRYARGEGVMQDHVHAHMWFNLAASQGNEKAVSNRDNITKSMTLTQISKAQELASKWKPQH